jgi:hypothetical protein
MGKLRDWWERCERNSQSVAAHSRSQKDGETAAVLSPHPAEPDQPAQPGEPAAALRKGE